MKTKIKNLNVSGRSYRSAFTVAELLIALFVAGLLSRNLYLITADGVQHILCDNVTSATFTKLPTGSPDVNSVQITMTVAAGPTRQTFTAAAAVRKNLR
jgi:hypothetical protein